MRHDTTHFHAFCCPNFENAICNPVANWTIGCLAFRCKWLHHLNGRWRGDKREMVFRFSFVFRWSIFFILSQASVENDSGIDVGNLHETHRFFRKAIIRSKRKSISWHYLDTQERMSSLSLAFWLTRRKDMRPKKTFISHIINLVECQANPRKRRQLIGKFRMKHFALECFFSRGFWVFGLSRE